MQDQTEVVAFVDCSRELDKQAVVFAYIIGCLVCESRRCHSPCSRFLVQLPRAGYGDGVVAVSAIAARNLEAAKGWGMHDVRAFNLKCEMCGKDIEELPFLPLTSSRPVYCRECNQKRPAAKKKGNTRRPRKRRR